MTAQNMYEEGLRLSPTLISSGGVMVRSVVNLLLENTRNPLMMIGDVRALMGTLKTGEERLRSLMNRNRMAELRGAAAYTLDLSERRMRAALSRVPDGDYDAERWIDDDGITPDPLRVSVSFRVRGDRAELDFSGTGTQSAGPLTTCWEDAARAVIGPKMMLDPRHPMNAGAMRPFDVLLPAGSVVLGLPPTSQSNHVEVGTKIAAVTIDAVSQACPEVGAASDSGTTGALTFWGFDSRPGRVGEPFFGIFMGGQGWGGTSRSDGVSFCLSPLYNCRAGVIEMAEIATPYVIWEWAAVMDSAGAGEYRGGFAAVVSMEALIDGFVMPMVDGARASAPGASGGGAGPMCYAVVHERAAGAAPPLWNGIMPASAYTPVFGIFDDEGRPDPDNGGFGNGTIESTCHLVSFPVTAGQVYRQVSAGAGGFGNPLDRDISAVLRDVSNELVSRAQARDIYGVIVDERATAVDETATRELRDDLRARQSAGEWVVPRAYHRDWPADQSEFDTLTGRALAQAAAQEA